MTIVVGSFCLVISVVGQMTSAKCSMNLMTAVGSLVVSGVCQVHFMFAMAAQDIIWITPFEIVSGCRPLHPYTAYRLLNTPLPVQCPPRYWHSGWQVFLPSLSSTVSTIRGLGNKGNRLYSNVVQWTRRTCLEIVKILTLDIWRLQTEYYPLVRALISRYHLPETVTAKSFTDTPFFLHHKTTVGWINARQPVLHV